MNIKTLSFKELFGDNNVYEQEIHYGGVLGQAEMIDGFFSHQFICFRKENNIEVAAISLTEIESKRERQVGNKILEHIGTNLRFGKKINKIINNNNIEEIYNIPLFSINDDYTNMRIYNYLISPELFIALGIGRQSNMLVDLEIINDKEIISEVIDARRNSY